MKKSGWDARRRNRNIGTPKQGRGQNNRFVIPESWADDRLFYEKLNNPVSLEVSVNGISLAILIEKTAPGFCHACTPDDIVKVLGLIPQGHLKPIQMIVLRQPKKKEKILASVWGRLRYWSEIEQYSGPAIHLEAQAVLETRRWSKSLRPDWVRELERLKDDGHHIESDKRYYYISHTIESIRNTQLYRTLPHEIGHYVDYLESVEIPAGDDYDKWDKLNKLYDSKPSKEKEDFAHRYATEFFKKQKSLGRLPFDRILDPKSLKTKDIDPGWFGNESENAL